MAIFSVSQNLLDEQIKALTAIPAVINERRRLWQEVVRTMLIEKLKEVKERAPQLGISVIRVRAAENQEFVQLMFKSEDSGISESESNTSKNYLKVGAVMTFTQLYAGKILAAYKMPFITGVIEEGSWTAYKVFEPKDISESDIENVVAEFFKEIIDWHDTMQQEKIGFKS